MAFLDGYCAKLTHHDLVRYQRKVQECGCDPFDLPYEDMEENREHWPRVTDVDRLDYLVFRTNFATKEAMKNYKSLEAHNFFTSNLVFPPRVKVISAGRVIVLGKVHHSQRHTLEPLKLWILAESNGNIVTGHCNCMAGRAETCSHIAATIFLLEIAAKATESLTCTDQLNGWLGSPMTCVPIKEVRHIDFSSADAKLKRLEAMVSGEQQPILKRRRRTSLPGAASQQWSDNFLSALAEANPIAVGLSTSKSHCTPFKNPATCPLDFSKLYDPTSEDLCYAELLVKCQKIMGEMSITAAEITNIEVKTRTQASSVLWQLYRLGRITGSMMAKVCQGNVNQPAKSTWEVICKGRSGSEESARRLSNNPDVRRGKEMEGVARTEYEAMLKTTHRNFKVRQNGLVLHPDHPFIGSSPDGLISCDCCPSYGCLEIKCPNAANLTSCLDGSGQLEKNHPYFYQVQSHMLVTGAKYCDLYLWIESSQNPQVKPVLVRVDRDQKKQEEMVAKCKDYFLYVILPEMVSHWHSRSVRPQPLQDQISNVNLPNICYCQQPRRDPMIICAGLNCTFKEFHCRCVDLSSASSRKKWYCQQCEPSAPKRKRRSTFHDENALLF